MASAFGFDLVEVAVERSSGQGWAVGGRSVVTTLGFVVAFAIHTLD
jgi:hypothetical protein